MTKARDVPRHEYRGFLSKAGDFLEAARAAVDKSAYSAAVSSCIHSAISAVDAITVMRTGKRPAARHVESLELVRSVLAGRGRADFERRYSFLLGLKNPAEYESTLMTARQAADALECAERILARARLGASK